MFRRRSKTIPDGGKAPDERLSAVLGEWHGIDPDPDFEAAVWRRIRASTAETRGLPLAVFLREGILPRPVWSTAMAAAVAVVIGGLAGVATSTAESRHHASEPLLHLRTLAGSYLHLTTGGNR